MRTVRALGLLIGLVFLVKAGVNAQTPYASEGRMCGGIAGIKCASGLVCNYTVNKGGVDASGICVKSTMVYCDNSKPCPAGYRCVTSWGTCPAGAVCSVVRPFCAKILATATPVPGRIYCTQNSDCPNGQICYTDPCPTGKTAGDLTSIVACSQRPYCRPATTTSTPTPAVQCNDANPCPEGYVCRATPPGGCPKTIVNGVEVISQCATVPKCWPVTPTSTAACMWCGDQCTRPNNLADCANTSPPEGKRCVVSDVDGSCKLIDLPIPGDANGSGTVDLADFSIWKEEYLRQSGDPGAVVIGGYAAADFDRSGAVDLLDFSIWKQAYLAVKPD